MRFLRSLVFFALLGWCVGTLGYKAATGAKLRAQLESRGLRALTIEKLTFNNYYLLESSRTAGVLLSHQVDKTSPDKPRGLDTEEFQLEIVVTGLFWPERVDMVSGRLP